MMKEIFQLALTALTLQACGIAWSAETAMQQARRMAPQDAEVTQPAAVAAQQGAGKWVLVWSDEFDGPDGSGVDPSKWVFDIGTGPNGDGWGNNELEYYTDRLDNASIRGGNLVIKAQREKYVSSDGVVRNYTSARLKTKGKFSQAYGRIESRIKIPFGQGLWSAFWMLGDDIDQVGWPECGEIDIMENVGKFPAVVFGTVHGPGHGTIGMGGSYTLPSGRYADDFHVFAAEWEPEEVRFYMDGLLYATRTKSQIRPGWKWALDHPHFILLNVAVGGDWPGIPYPSTVMPQYMLVDYVRVYRRAGP